MTERTISAYARELRPLLPSTIFAPAHSRLLWLPIHVGVLIAAMSSIAFDWVAWPFQVLMSPLIGASFAGLTFLAHETLHGAVVRQRTLRRLVGFLGFLPFAVSPRLWVAWHNRVHHGHTNEPGVDPDAYPTLAEYGKSRAVRWATDYGAPGRGRLRGALALLVGFTVQSTHMLVDARRTGMLTAREQRLAIAETAVGWCTWLVLAALLGPVDFLLAYVVPLLFANAIVMALILTNHSLSPHTAVNDPLLNSLSVTGPRVLEWVTLHFGFHVEHHLFPAMSGRHARTLREQLRRLWPAQYQSLPYVKALLALHRSPRVYATPTTLVDPSTGMCWPTLASSLPGRVADATEPRRLRPSLAPSSLRPS